MNTIRRTATTLLASACFFAMTGIAPAAVLVNFTFDGDGASDGDSLTSTANSGTLGGNATGTLTAQYDTSGNGTLGGMTIGSGTSNQGNIGYTKGSTTANIDWTVAFALRRDGTQSTFNRIWDTTMGVNMFWDGGNPDNIEVNFTASTLPDIATSDGVWTHIALTYDHGVGVELFQDGVSLGSTLVGVPTFDFGAAQSFYLLGRGTTDPDNRTMSGAIDNFQIHDEVLSQSAIFNLALQSGTVQVPEPSTLAMLLMCGALLLFRRRIKA